MKVGIISDFFPMYGAKAVAKLVSALEESGHSAMILASNMLQNGQYTKNFIYNTNKTFE